MKVSLELVFSFFFFFNVDVFIYFLNIFLKITVYIQYYSVFASGAWHSGYTIIYFTKCSPISSVPSWCHT